VTIAEFVKRQIPIYVSFGENEHCDLIADFNGKLNRVQCKTSQIIKDNKLIWSISTTTTGVGGKATRYKYTKDDVDYFALYNIEANLLLLVSIDSILNDTYISFNYPFKKNTNGAIAHNWEEFILEKVINMESIISEDTETAC